MFWIIFALLLHWIYCFPDGSAGKESSCQCRRHRRHGFNPWVRKIPWKREWQPTPVFSPGECHGQRSLASYIGLQRVGHKLATKTPKQIFVCFWVIFMSYMKYLFIYFAHCFFCFKKLLYLDIVWYKLQTYVSPLFFCLIFLAMQKIFSISYNIFIFSYITSEFWIIVRFSPAFRL